MNNVKLAARKLRLQRQQLNELKPYKAENPSRYNEQKDVLNKLWNPRILFKSTPFPKDPSKPYIKHLNGLTNLAKNDEIYEAHIYGVKS